MWLWHKYQLKLLSDMYTCMHVCEFSLDQMPICQWRNKLRNAVQFAMSKFGKGYVLPTNVNPDKLSFCCQGILSLLDKAISKTIMALESYELSNTASMCSQGGNTTLFLLKQLSLSLLWTIRSLSLREVLLETHFGYILTMGCDCFILLSHMLQKNYGTAFLHQGTRQQ